MDTQTIRIRLKAFDHRTLDQSVSEIISTANEQFEATAEQYRKIARSKVVNRADLRKYVVQVLRLQEDENGKMPTITANTVASATALL